MTAPSLPLVPLPASVTLTDAAPYRPADPDDLHLTVTVDASTGGPESSSLQVTERGIRIMAADPAGAFYARQTLAQLETDGVYPAVEIQDAPRFRYRGVMLDVARHFQPVETVRAYIDHAASLKFNHLHLHLTDDQGWRIALDSRPELTEKASGTSALGDPGGYYAQADWTAILDHAASRHMTVVPEIDVPGHTHAVGVAYPGLVADPVISDHILETAEAFGGGIPTRGFPYTGFAVGFSSLKHDDPAVDAFLADVFGELAAITPGPYLHIGGDECLGTDPADYAAFVEKATAIVAAAGKIPVAWHEAGAVAGIHPSTVGQYWNFVQPQEGQDAPARAFATRGGLILSPADVAYLDMKFDALSPLGLVWAKGVTTLRDAYDWEPTAILDGVGEQQILGIEAPLWSETARDLGDLEQLAFPRIGAIAEIAWSPAAAHDWDSFAARIAGLVPRWRSAGIRIP
ncbi:MAG TPA: family 20 glycosylhydrolase [Microbacterium sp.]|uniref:family 20 glycosylhydrolase n=1 Tax=Microbacterium sp. TaxID=51671 RepID=UPI002B4A80D0|nr:family 20 glycosylhydrolase [Microbacterium sp.]HKT58312.1 family 20 glycosylhydrolase [Microbacterium sp.]